MLKEFKKFALKGNMLDLAVGIIIGGAFSSLVNSLVNDVIMPVFSVITSKINFTDWFIALDGKQYDSLQQAVDKKAIVIKYGVFLSGTINFVIMAFVVFLVVKWLNKMKKPDASPQPATKKCPRCLSEINAAATKCPQCTADLAQ